MVVNLAKKPVDSDLMHKQWRDFLELLGNIADDLVIRLISSEFFAQFIDHMMSLSIKPEILRNLSVQTLQALKISPAIRDWEMASAAINEHFDRLNMVSVKAISKSYHSKLGYNLISDNSLWRCLISVHRF
jgi:hypothetical protein|tara:strand:+ start:1102 stop:1494 length:393 start_codon:yes stop_codon:yes gene_type:complete